jgi:hypothetical protein
MAARLGVLVISDLRGGRNGVDYPLALPEVQVCEAENVDWFTGMLGRRRNGAINLSLNGSSLTSTLRSLHRYLPTNLENDQQLFAFARSGTGTVGQCARSVFGIWTPVTMLDATQDKGITEAVSFNYKLFLAHKNVNDRLEVFDPLTSTTSFRLPGYAAPTTAPIVQASAVAGSISGQRWYQTAVTRQVSGGVTAARSERSAAGTTTITSQTGWKVLQQAGINTLPYATHWEVYGGASSAGPWYLLATLPIATTSYIDTIAVASFPPVGIPLAPTAGSQFPAPNGKYLVVDEARLLIGGSYAIKSYESRVWWTPVLTDASGVNNDERVNLSLNPFIDFEPGDGGGLTGMGGPLFDCPYVFKLERIYKMVRTGNSQAPYRPVTVSRRVGAIHHRTIVTGEDQHGEECIYFLSRRGPYRVGASGIEYLGRDIEDVWTSVNLDTATTSGLETGIDVAAGAHGVYHHDLHQVWWWVPTGNYGDAPLLKIVIDTRLAQAGDVHGVRGGWCRHTGGSARAVCSRMASDRTQVSASASLNPLSQKPHIGYVNASLPVLVMCDATGVATDATVSEAGVSQVEQYTALLRTRAIAINENVAILGGVLEAQIVLRNLFSGTSQHLRIAAIRDFGVETRESDLVAVPLVAMLTTTPVGNDAIIAVRDLGMISAAVVQIEIGDKFVGSPTPVNWVIDQLVLRVRREEDR